MVRSPDYVLQQALASVEEEQKEELFAKVRPQLASMRRYSNAYSRHLISSKCAILSPTWMLKASVAVERLLTKRESRQPL
jgi:pumilio RNA-binding family